MKGLIKQVIDAQKESDQLLVQLEEKRMKMEEAHQEQDYKMHRDDQEYQMRVLQMITGSYHISQPSLNKLPSYSAPYSGNNPPYSSPYSETSSPYWH